MGNAIRKEFGQGSHRKSALGGGTHRAKKVVQVVLSKISAQWGEGPHFLRTFFMEEEGKGKGKGSVGSRKD